MIKICALWRSETKDGMVYYRGRSGEIEYLVFPNKNKEAGDKRPDYDLMMDARVSRKKE